MLLVRVASPGDLEGLLQEIRAAAERHHPHDGGAVHAVRGPPLLLSPPADLSDRGGAGSRSGPAGWAHAGWLACSAHQR